MTISFPNRSRRYDPRTESVCFIGYDGMFEVAFLVEGKILARKGLPEQSYLDAFDASSARIYAAALKVYKGRRPTPYVIVSIK